MRTHLVIFHSSIHKVCETFGSGLLNCNVIGTLVSEGEEDSYQCVTAVSSLSLLLLLLKIS